MNARLMLSALDEFFPITDPLFKGAHSITLHGDALSINVWVDGGNKCYPVTGDRTDEAVTDTVEGCRAAALEIKKLLELREAQANN